MSCDLTSPFVYVGLYNMAHATKLRWTYIALALYKPVEQ